VSVDKWRFAPDFSLLIKYNICNINKMSAVAGIERGDLEQSFSFMDSRQVQQ
jgi:hypothetical protein